MNVIITGGSGFIGRQLTSLLLQNGCKVTILSRNAAHHSNQIQGAHIINWDAHTSAGWVHLVENSDVIVNLTGANLAGEGLLPTRWSSQRKEIIRSSRLQAGEAVVQAVKMAKTKPTLVVQASGVGYYGNTKDNIVDEESPVGHDYMARLAADWENSTQPVEEMGVRRIIIRSAVNLSASEGALPRTMLPFRLYAGGPLGNGRQYFPWIHPYDEAAAIFFLIQNRLAFGAFNLSAPQTVTNSQFGRILSKIMTRPYWLPAPAFAIRLALGEVADMVLTGQRVEPKRLKEMGYVFKYPELKQALESVLAGKTETGSS